MRTAESDGLLILLLLWAWGRNSTPETTPAPAARRDPSMIDVGWWWYWYPPELDADVATWRRKQRSTLRITRTFGGAALGATVIVFEVRKRFRWKLPGLPEPAKRGADTDLSDVAWAIPSPPSPLRRMVETATKATWEYLRQIYEGRRPPREPFPGTR